MLVSVAYLIARIVFFIAFGASGSSLIADTASPATSGPAGGYVERDLATVNFGTMFADRRGEEAVAEQPATLPETRLDLTLRGIRQGADPQSGVALIQAGSADQSYFAVGEEISDGVELREVHQNHVIIARRGILETLHVREPSTRRQPAANPEADADIAAEPERASPTPDRPMFTANQIRNARSRPGQRVDLAGLVQVDPRFIDDALVGYALVGGNQTLLDSVGLRMNDILVEIDGRSVTNADDIQDLFEDLRSDASVELAVIRSGFPVNLTVDMPDVPNR